MRKWLMVRRQPGERGQSLVELTLFLPILLLLLVGLVEIGVLVNSYIAALDSSRAAARYVSPLDPFQTRCNPFGQGTTEWISFNPNCSDGEYNAKAQDIKRWGPELLYDRCKASDTTNFFYVASCLAVLNLPRGGLDPNPKSVWSPNDYRGDDIVVSTLPITGGAVVNSWVLANGTRVDGKHTWSLFGNQPSPKYPSIIDTNFTDVIGNYATAPATGLVVVEVYHAHPQFTKLFTVANALVRGTAVIPDPIPIHTYSVFPLPADEPRPGG